MQTTRARLSTTRPGRLPKLPSFDRLSGGLTHRSWRGTFRSTGLSRRSLRARSGSLSHGSLSDRSPEPHGPGLEPQGAVPEPYPPEPEPHPRELDEPEPEPVAGRASAVAGHGCRPER